MNDSCRVLLVPGGRKELIPAGQSPAQPLAQSAKSMEKEKKHTHRAARAWSCACKDLSFLALMMFKKKRRSETMRERA